MIHLNHSITLLKGIFIKLSLCLKITRPKLQLLVLKCEIPNFTLKYHQNPGSPKVAAYMGVSGEGQVTSWSRLYERLVETKHSESKSLVLSQSARVAWVEWTGGHGHRGEFWSRAIYYLDFVWSFGTLDDIVSGEWDVIWQASSIHTSLWNMLYVEEKRCC